MLNSFWNNGLGTKTLSGILIILTTSTVGVGYKAVQTLAKLEQKVENIDNRLERRDSYYQREIQRLERRIESME